MSLVLTGATGFVGRNLLLRLLAAKEPVQAVVRDTGKLRAQIMAEGWDVNSIQTLPTQPSEWPPIAPTRAVLCAGALFARTREEYFTTNVDWTLSIIRALPESCRIVVLSSLAAAGPTPKGVDALTEESTEQPITWYGQSKLAMEQAIRREFPNRPIAILRPPMVLGPRDSATLPLFKMTRGYLRVKPGVAEKHYSFIAVDDLVEAILAALEAPAALPTCFVAHERTISDRELIATAGEKPGRALAVPHAVLRQVARVVNAVPALREAIPSLSGDRVLEVWEDRWVVDASKFSALTGWKARRDLKETLDATRDFYRREGKL